jgi:hypothetical protein
MYISVVKYKMLGHSQLFFFFLQRARDDPYAEGRGHTGREVRGRSRQRQHCRHRAN